MKISIALASVILAVTVFAETKKVYKNSIYGYSFSYPGDWYPVVEDEPLDDGRPVSVDKASYITFYKDKEKRKYCKDKRDCTLSSVSLGHKDVKAYNNELKWIDDHIKYERTSNPPKTKVQKLKFNGYDVDIVLKEMGKEELQVHTFFYCSSSNLISYFISKRQRNVADDIMDIKRPITLEELYTAEQFLMVNSFRCPKSAALLKRPR